jgi:hypothetical protein
MLSLLLITLSLKSSSFIFLTAVSKMSSIKQQEMFRAKYDDMSRIIQKNRNVTSLCIQLMQITISAKV